MRLLNTATLELATFISSVPEYVILSHRWESDELTFEDTFKTSINDPESPARNKLGFSKVSGTCALAARDGFDWVWIDTLCIDKSSSSELQEAINSMFRWYTEAQLCYAFLSDLPDESSGWNEQFGHSLWFTRAWTLQELLAPCAVEFYAVDWSPIGTRQSRCSEISSITGIAPVALTASWMYIKDTFLTAQKLSWAAHRQAIRGEDAAYSLLGLFDVNMPMLYGEGGHRAFSRLQKAIYKKDGDHSLFLFRPRLESHTVPLLAESISGFCQRQKCDLCSSDGRGQSAYHNFPYSTLKITRNLHGTIESDHFIKIVRDGVMVKLPTARFREIPTHHISNLVSDVPTCPDTEFGTDLVLAVLNVSCPGQGTVVIPLRLHGLGTYERQRMSAILLRPSFDPSGAQCLPIMVRQPNFERAGTPVRTVLRVRSSSDLVKSWTCTNLNGYLPGLGEYAIVGE
jgi:hypothetical protein